MEIKKGIPVSPGVSIGEALVLGQDDIRVRRRSVARSRIDREVKRLDRALARSVAEINDEISRLGDGMQIPKQVLASHRDIIADSHFREEIVGEIRSQAYSAEHAVVLVLRRYHKKLAEMESEYFSERAHDIQDIERTILHVLLGKARATKARARADTVLVSHNLTASQAALLDRATVRAFAIDVGGRTSHIAIMARAMQMPAVVGLEDFSESITSGEQVIVDGYTGTVVTNPDSVTLSEYRRKAAVSRGFYSRLHGEVRLPAETLDGYEVSIAANIEFPEEIETALEWGACGVGLYRTEFLYDATHPDEARHFRSYRQAVEQLRGRYLVVRTLDAGADKFHTEAVGYQEPNPFLGCRSIRLCLQRPELFRAQIRAVLRVSVMGPVRIMLPMVSTLEELRQAKKIIAEVEEELETDGVRFDRKVPLGIMVEVPSAALVADVLAREVDFFSIGTNDLVQYCLAVDRLNERVADLYQPTHPSILRLVRTVIEAGSRQSIDVSICGEMCSEPLYTILLLGLGLRSFSVSPIAIPIVKRVVRKINMRDAVAVAETCLTHETAEESQEFLESRVRGMLPEIF
jgi:phosphotransferase system enzyme I (PtsI)